MNIENDNKLNLPTTSTPSPTAYMDRYMKNARKFTGRPPFTENDVYINRGKYTLYVVLPNGTAMTPCHDSKSTLVDIVNRAYPLLAKQRWSRRN